jgi:hypothetical protein
MKAEVTRDDAGIHFEIKDDGSAEYQKAAQLTREVNEREDRGCKAMRDLREPLAWAVIPSTVLAGRAWRVTLDKEEAERLSCGAMLVVPLCEQPQPTLTDEERAAIELAADVIAECEDDDGEPLDGVALTLRGILDRLK